MTSFPESRSAASFRLATSWMSLFITSSSLSLKSETKLGFNSTPNLSERLTPSAEIENTFAILAKDFCRIISSSPIDFISPPSVTTAVFAQVRCSNSSLNFRRGSNSASGLVQRPHRGHLALPDAIRAGAGSTPSMERAQVLCIFESYRRGKVIWPPSPVVSTACRCRPLGPERPSIRGKPLRCWQRVWLQIGL